MNDRTMQISTASPDLRAEVHAIIARQMADELVAENVDLNDIATVEFALRFIGFGHPSVDALAERAMLEARSR